MNKSPSFYNESDLLAIEVRNMLKKVLDPELSVNIIDMGLVYSIRANTGKDIIISMTLSSRGCPMGEAILENVKLLLQMGFPAYEIIIELVWQPEWSPDFISHEGREFLGMN